MDGALRLQQSFNVQARMKPGDSQEVGPACLWIVEGDGETALRRIPEWMRRRGHVPPADRAAWSRLRVPPTVTAYCCPAASFPPIQAAAWNTISTPSTAFCSVSG